LGVVLQPQGHRNHHEASDAEHPRRVNGIIVSTREMPTLPLMMRTKFIIADTLPPFPPDIPAYAAVLMGTKSSARRSDLALS
jgi:hypothetical protein